MLTLLVILAVCFGGVLYTQAGLELGRLGLKAWEEEDNETTTSFLLFPVSHMNGVVGTGSAFVASTHGDGHSANYKFLMALGWPLKLLWNSLALAGFVGPAKIARSLKVIERYERRLKEARERRRLLLARSSTAEIKLPLLKALRDEFDEEIADAEAEAGAEREARIAELNDVREKAEHEIFALEAQKEAEDCPYAALCDAGDDARPTAIAACASADGGGRTGPDDRTDAATAFAGTPFIDVA